MISRKNFITSFISLLATSQVHANSSQKRKLRIAVYVSTIPISDNVNNEYWEGIQIDLTKLVLAGIDSVEPEFIPNLRWNRAIDAVKQGQIDLLYQVSFRDERLVFLDYIGVNDVERMYLIMAENSSIKSIETLDDLANISPPVWIIKGVVYDPVFDELIKTDPEFRAKFYIDDLLMSYNSDQINEIIKLISAGRISGFTVKETDIGTYKMLAEKMMQTDPTISPVKGVRITPFREAVTYLAAGRHVPEAIRAQMIQNYNNARADGSFEKIWKRWQPERELPPFVLPGEQGT